MNDVRDDSGTTAVELALVIGILLVAVLGAVDFGLWMFQKSEASQAAREASRVAMISPPTPGPQAAGSPVYDAAQAEVETNLPGFAVTVVCSSLTPTGPQNETQCVPGTDTVTVTVQWHRDPLTVVGVTDTVSGSSTRTVVGTP